MSARAQAEKVLEEVGRFLLVGGAATLSSLLVFNVLSHGFLIGHVLVPQPIPAFVIANTIGMLVSYQGAKNFAFKGRSASGKDGGFIAYVVINVATMVLPIACLAISRDVLRLDDPVSDNIAANGVGLVLGLGARFYLFRTFVFRRPVSLFHLYDEPLLEETPEVESLEGGPVSELSTDLSTIGPLPPPFA